MANIAHIQRSIINHYNSDFLKTMSQKEDDKGLANLSVSQSEYTTAYSFDHGNDFSMTTLLQYYTEGDDLYFHVNVKDKQKEVLNVRYRHVDLWRLEHLVAEDGSIIEPHKLAYSLIMCRPPENVEM